MLTIEVTLFLLAAFQCLLLQFDVSDPKWLVRILHHHMKEQDQLHYTNLNGKNVKHPTSQDHDLLNKILSVTGQRKFEGIERFKICTDLPFYQSNVSALNCCKRIHPQFLYWMFSLQMLQLSASIKTICVEYR